MYSDDILEFDVNSIIKDDIKTTINNYKKRLDNCEKDKRKMRLEMDEMSKKLIEVNNLSFLISSIQKTYSNIQADPRTDEFPKSKAYKQFMFIKDTMKTIFGIDRKYNNNISRDCNNILLWTNLAVNYYDNRDIIINLLNILDPPCNYKNCISTFKMPFDYDKKDVIEYVRNPHYNVNGNMFGISDYWLEKGAGKINMPHDLMMKNPHILEPDVFNILLETIEANRGHYHYLFALPLYNNHISKNQIEMLGDCLIFTHHSGYGTDVVSKFIENNLHKFNTKTLDYLYLKITDDNHYRTFHWENFPIEYQMKYLKSKPFEHINKILNDYSCKWTMKDKEKFLKSYFSER